MGKKGSKVWNAMIKNFGREKGRKMFFGLKNRRRRVNVLKKRRAQNGV